MLCKEGLDPRLRGGERCLLFASKKSVEQQPALRCTSSRLQVAKGLTNIVNRKFCKSTLRKKTNTALFHLCVSRETVKRKKEERPPGTRKTAPAPPLYAVSVVPSLLERASGPRVVRP